MKCPFCGSEHVQYVSHTTRTNFGGLQAYCGFILMGPLGLLCGLCGQSESTSEYWVCHDCGNTFPTFMGTWKMQRVNNKEESRKQQEALRQKERDQYYSNKVYLSPLANAEGTYTEALKAYEALDAEGIAVRVVDMFTWKPLDEELVLRCAAETGAIVTAENHNVVCGLGSAVANCLAKNHPTVQEFVGVQDMFGQVGPQSFLMDEYGLRASNIVAAVKKAIGRK